MFGLLAPVAAQERMAAVQLEDGRRLEGRVLSMNLKVLEIQVGNQILTVPASLIRSCRFKQSGDPVTPAPPEGAASGDPEPTESGAPPVAKDSASPLGAQQGVEPAAQQGAQPGAQQGAQPGAQPSAQPGAQPSAQPGAQPVEKPVEKPTEQDPTTAQEPPSAPAGESAPVVKTAAAPAPKPTGVTWTGPLQDPVDPNSYESVPVDQRRSHWQRRIGNLDRAYPWLAPAAPSQWISLGIMLLVGLGLIVHLSVRVAGSEESYVGRSFGLGIWYLMTGLGQMAMVPVNDLTTVLMILLNSSLSLFGLCGLFGLPRGGAAVALMVQLGFAVLVYGILELVTALLGSVGVAA